jgi:hypothetical protein
MIAISSGATVVDSELTRHGSDGDPAIRQERHYLVLLFGKQHVHVELRRSTAPRADDAAQESRFAYLLESGSRTAAYKETTIGEVSWPGDVNSRNRELQ